MIDDYVLEGYYEYIENYEFVFENDTRTLQMTGPILYKNLVSGLLELSEHEYYLHRCWEMMKFKEGFTFRISAMKKQPTSTALDTLEKQFMTLNLILNSRKYPTTSYRMMICEDNTMSIYVEYLDGYYLSLSTVSLYNEDLKIYYRYPGPPKDDVIYRGPATIKFLDSIINDTSGKS